jgi:uncharacterized protein (DUF2062 family)
MCSRRLLDSSRREPTLLPVDGAGSPGPEGNLGSTDRTIAGGRHVGRLPRLRRFLIWIIRLRGSPHAIAGGVAIGMVVAFTPTIGFQTVLALGLATLLNANRPIAIVPTWISNPVTALPIYAFTYRVGSLFWPGPGAVEVARTLRDAVRELEKLDFLAMHHQLAVFAELGVDIFVPLTIGGLIVGGVAAAISYPLTVGLMVRLRARRRRRRGAAGSHAPAPEAGPPTAD